MLFIERVDDFMRRAESAHWTARFAELVERIEALETAAKPVEEPKEQPKAKRKIVKYMNIYPPGCSYAPVMGAFSVAGYVTRAAADKVAGEERIACKRVEIEFEEGEFDE